MTIKRYFIFIAVFLFLLLPVSAFEDTFQYYPGGDFSAIWYEEGDEIAGPPHADYDVSIINDGDATYSRSIKLYAADLPSKYLSSDWAWSSITSITPTESSYWSFNVREISADSGQIIDFKIYFYDLDGYLIGTTSDFYPTYMNEIGLWEISITGNTMYLRINGVDKGSLGSCSDTPAYIKFYTYLKGPFNNVGTHENVWIIDDVSTGGNLAGIGYESTSRTITESNLNPTNMSFTINSFPFATYTSTEYEINIKRYEAGTLTSVASEVVKESGNSSVFTGFSNYNRSVDLTDSDTAYGLYTVYLTGNGVSKDTDYFFFAPPGDVSTISFSNPDIPIGTTETISYSIDAADFGTYNYHVRIYSTTAQIQSTQVSEASSTVTWDTTGESTGLHYAVLSRTDKTTGAYSELTYDIATLSDTIIIKGYAYDAQNESALANVNVNFSQAATWYNTTSNSTGYYELTGLIVNTEVDVNASLVDYTHENFTFTPLSAEIYTMDLYLINNTPTYSNTTIGGLTYDYPLHQAVTNATVNIYNSTWSDTTTSSITGFYLFEELTNGSYTVNATKTDYQDSAEYPADTNNGSWLTQNILMYGIYDLTIRAQDSSTDGYLSTFSVDYGGVISSTTNGSITYSGLTYGLYTFSVSATGYYSTSEDILVDSTKTETIQLTQTDSVYYVQHFVKFTVQNIWGTKYPGVSVSVYEGSASTTTYTGTTGSDGSATFKLYETTQYRITFVNATAGISETRTLYPVDNHYYIIVSSTVGSWDTYTVPISDAIDFTITKNIINSTHSYINVSYNDSQAETTDLKVYLNQTSESDYFNQTNLDTWNAGATSSGSHSFIVEDYAGQSYLIRLLAEHTTYNTIDSTYSVSFKDDIATKFPGLPPSVWLYSSIFILLFTGGIFVSTNVEKGMLVVCIMFFVFYGLGAFNTLPSNVQQSMLAGGILGFILSIIANLNKGNRDEGFN